MSALATADVIVVGLGAMGSATCNALAARGATVIGIDQHQPPHELGSTHGDTRITRLAIGEGADYVPLVRRSHELWREIEQQAGVSLLVQQGGIVLGRPDSAFLAETGEAARRFGIGHENLSRSEIAERFPMFEPTDEIEAYYEPEAGYVRVEEAVSAQLSLGRRNGARLQLGERVDGWSASERGVTVRTAAGTYAGAELVLCAGAWIGALFDEGRELFNVYRQLLCWFEIDRGFEQLREMPVFVWDLGGEQGDFVHLDVLYGFPALDGPGGGLKVGAESYDHLTSADEPRAPATADEIAQMHARHVAPRFPWLTDRALRTVTCLYTCTRSTRFVIDRHPEHERVWIVSPCSGHGFKHSPAIGEAIAQHLTEGASEVDLEPFSLARARS